MPGYSKIMERPASRSQQKARLKKSKQGSSNEVVPRSRIQAAGLGVLLILLTAGVYWQVGSHPFVNYDDEPYVTGNSHVKAGLTWDTFTWAFAAYEAGNWHPVTWLSHAVDCELYGLNAGGHHVTNLVIHIFNVVLVFLLLYWVTGEKWKSWMVGALFALHPLNVESVAWIAERKNVLSTLFFLLALGAYGWHARKPGVRRYLCVTLLFALGLASKPMVITLPFVLLLLDYWPLGRVLGWSEVSASFPVKQEPAIWLIFEKLPLLLLSAASGVVTVAAQGTSVIPTHALPFAVRVETAFYAYVLYLWKMIWPVHLAIMYPHPGRNLGILKPALGLLIVLGASVLAWVQRKTRPYLIFGWLWYLGMAVPIIGVVQVGLQIIADRYAYVPLLGIFVAVVWSASSLLKEFAELRVRAVAVSSLLVVLGIVAWRQVGYWRDSITLWSHAVESTSDNSIAENYLANTLFREGRYEEGITHLRIYANREPLDPEAHARVAADYQDRSRFAEAAKEYEAAVRASSQLEKNGVPGLNSGMLAAIYINLGLTYRQLGSPERALENSRTAVAIDRRAVAQMQQELRDALSSQPSAAGYVRLGMLLQNTGDELAAEQAYQTARRLDPAMPLPAP